MPAFPQPFTSTVSHWQATVSGPSRPRRPLLNYLYSQNRGPTSLWNHGRDAPLPTKADIVIVGAGVTGESRTVGAKRQVMFGADRQGSSLAYHLTRPGEVGEGKRIIVLEAKDVASGACE